MRFVLALFVVLSLGGCDISPLCEEAPPASSATVDYDGWEVKRLQYRVEQLEKELRACKEAQSPPE